jgi:predicted TIM-barrel fold metal-dependent hydrolase
VPAFFVPAFFVSTLGVSTLGHGRSILAAETRAYIRVVSGTDASGWLISVDDHVLEPPGVWQDRLPSGVRDRAPRLVIEDGSQVWTYEGRRMPVEGLAAVAGKDKTEYSSTANHYDQMRPGCYDPVARARDMDLDRVLASMCFPSFPRFCGQVFLEATDKDLARMCVEAYNNWMIDEWCASVPGRFIPLTLIPLWDPHGAAVEIERCAAKGARAFCFSENPAQLGLPSLYDRDRHWDPVLAAANDTGMVVCTHIGSSSRLPKTAPDSALISSVALAPLNALTNLVDWIFSGMLVRHPNLKLALSEGGIGWIPYVLERCAYSLERHRHWAGRDDATFKGDTVTGLGNEYLRDLDVHALFRDHVFGCFIDDQFGAQNLDAIGVDNVMAETDYPHTDSSWPHSMGGLRRLLEGRSAEDVWKVLQGNARRVFDFEPAEPPTY